MLSPLPLCSLPLSLCIFLFLFLLSTSIMHGYCVVHVEFFPTWPWEVHGLRHPIKSRPLAVPETFFLPAPGDLERFLTLPYIFTLQSRSTPPRADGVLPAVVVTPLVRSTVSIAISSHRIKERSYCSSALRTTVLLSRRLRGVLCSLYACTVLYRAVPLTRRAGCHLSPRLSDVSLSRAGSVLSI